MTIACDLIDEKEPLEIQPLAECPLAELVTRAQDGSREAFGELAQRYERSIYVTALRRVGDPYEAQEIVQEVLLQAMRKLDQLRQPEAFGGWLRQIAVRMATNRQTRQRGAIATEPDLLSAVCVDHATPLTAALASERRHQVRLGLRRLRALDRETLVAFYVKGRTLLEMSDDFRSPVGTIKRRLHVARKRLAKELEAVDVA